MRYLATCFLVLMIIGVLACTEPIASEFVPIEVERRTVTGVLVYHSQRVRSYNAWIGVEFTVNGVSLIPTGKVSREKFKSFVGFKVTAMGDWNPGQEWDPSSEDPDASRPVFPENLDGQETPLVRGEGIEVDTLKRVKK